jgi:hypothetical protein
MAQSDFMKINHTLFTHLSYQLLSIEAESNKEDF